MRIRLEDAEALRTVIMSTMARDGQARDIKEIAELVGAEFDRVTYSVLVLTDLDHRLERTKGEGRDFYRVPDPADS
jgi:hypothetical protein